MSVSPSFKPLTKAEESIMQVLWKLKTAYVKDIVAAMPAPQPHYNTINTLLRILAEKGFVTSETLGGSRQFTPLISHDDYRARSLKKMMKGYFGGSVANLISFFVKEKEVGVEELEAILNELKKDKK